MNPKITIVTVCYNAEKNIENTILSIIGQTYNNVEYIVIDGFSNDNTMHIINKYKNNISKVVSEPDKGIFDAMNKGLRLATGDWINFMNAGDCFTDHNVLSNLIKYISNNIFVLYGNAFYFRRTGRELVVAEEPHYILRNMPNTHQAFFVNKKISIKIGFSLNYKYASDYNMIYSIYKQFGENVFYHVPLTICNYEAIEGVSINAPLDVQKEVLEIRNHDIWWFYDKIKWHIKKMIKK